MTDYAAEDRITFTWTALPAGTHTYVSIKPPYWPCYVCGLPFSEHPMWAWSREGATIQIGDSEG